MRQHERAGRDRRDTLDQFIRTMRDIDDDAQVLAAPNHLGAEVAETNVYGRLGLDVTDVADVKVGELQQPQAVLLEGFVDTFDSAVEKVCAFTRDDHRWSALA